MRRKSWDKTIINGPVSNKNETSEQIFVEDRNMREAPPGSALCDHPRITETDGGVIRLVYEA
jgi:hypothetical protein